MYIFIKKMLAGSIYWLFLSCTAAFAEIDLSFDKEWGDVDGWNVAWNNAHHGCFAVKELESGSVIWFGMSDPVGSSYVAIASQKWNFFTSGMSYEVGFVTDAGRRFSKVLTGFEINGYTGVFLQARSSGDVNDILSAGTIRVYWSDQVLETLRLMDTAAVQDVVRKCTTNGVMAKGLVTTSRPARPDILKQAVNLTNEAARLINNRDIKAALSLIQQADALYQSIYGSNAIELAEIYDNFASAYYAAGDYTGAERYYRQVISIVEKQLGQGHPKSGDALKRLASLKLAKGEIAEAVKIYRRVLSIRESALGARSLAVSLDLMNLGYALRASRHYGESEMTYKRSLNLREALVGPRSDLIITTLNHLADLYDDTGNYVASDQLSERALQMSNSLHGENQVATLPLLLYQGQAKNRRGMYSDSEKIFRKAASISVSFDEVDDETTAIILEEWTTALTYLGRFDEAESKSRQALALREKQSIPDRTAEARGLGILAELFRLKGDYQDAEATFRRALLLSKEDVSDGRAIMEGNYALLLHSVGRYEEGASIARKSLQTLEKRHGPEHPAVANQLVALGLIAYSQGHYAKAEAEMRRALAIQDRAFGILNVKSASTLGNLAAVLLVTERYDEAEPLQRRALEAMEHAVGADHFLTAGFANNLAETLKLKGKYDEAERIGRSALNVLERTVGPSDIRVAIVVNNIGTLAALKKNYKSAAKSFERSLALEEAAFGPQSAYVATTLDNLGVVREWDGDDAGAEALYRRAIGIREAVLGADHPDAARTYNRLGKLLSARGEFAAALGHFRRAASLGHLESGSYLNALRGLRRQVSPDQSDAFLEESFEVVQEGMITSAGSAMNQLAARFSAGTDKLAELVRAKQDLDAKLVSLNKIVLEQLAKAPADRRPDVEKQIHNTVKSTETQLNEISQSLRNQFPDYAELERPSMLELKKVQSLLSDEEGLIVLDTVSNSVWAVSHTDALWQVTKSDGNTVKASVRLMRNAIASGVRGASAVETVDEEVTTSYDYSANYELYRDLLQPVESVFKGKRKLIFVLDGITSSIPPAALVLSDPTGYRGASVDWLIKHYAVTVLPSVSSLRTLRGHSQLAEAPKPLRGYADPVFNRHATTQVKNTSRGFTSFYRGGFADLDGLSTALQKLPETADELKAVASSVGASSSDIILGDAATETAVKTDNLDDYRIVYFATHGLLAGEVSAATREKAEPAIVLSLPQTPTRLDDGLLMASEVAQLKLRSDWVVLSACNTAAGDEPGAEALSGLARAFFYAGARTLLVSHWPVESQSAVSLMTNTFRAMSEDNFVSASVALQTAILAVMNDADHPRWSEPAYWAPFILVGEPR
jgi:CHAT domain-containing protein/tetratricopeptide (TPR) repeat protein